LLYGPSIQEEWFFIWSQEVKEVVHHEQSKACLSGPAAALAERYGRRRPRFVTEKRA
jgi:hypothetical protein